MRSRLSMAGVARESSGRTVWLSVHVNHVKAPIDGIPERINFFILQTDGFAEAGDLLLLAGACNIERSNDVNSRIYVAEALVVTGI